MSKLCPYGNRGCPRFNIDSRYAACYIFWSWRHNADSASHDFWPGMLYSCTHVATAGISGFTASKLDNKMSITWAVMQARNASERKEWSSWPYTYHMGVFWPRITVLHLSTNERFHQYGSEWTHWTTVHSLHAFHANTTLNSSTSVSTGQFLPRFDNEQPA